MTGNLIPARKLKKIVKYDDSYVVNEGPIYLMLALIIAFAFWRGYERDFPLFFSILIGVDLIWFVNWLFSRNVYYRRVR